MSKVNILKSYVPDFLSESIIFNEIYNTQGAECDSVDTAMVEILDQCYIDTTTWGLKFWEKFLSIPVDEAKDMAYRRSVIKSKIRGIGTVTVNLIQSVAQSFDNGEVAIIEHNNTYSFEVKFISAYGIPININDLKDAVDQIKPAHLEVIYTFRYLIWDELDSKNNSWDYFDSKNLTWDNFEIGGWI